MDQMLIGQALDDLLDAHAGRVAEPDLKHLTSAERAEVESLMEVVDLLQYSLTNSGRTRRGQSLPPCHPHPSSPESRAAGRTGSRDT